MSSYFDRLLLASAKFESNVSDRSNEICYTVQNYLNLMFGFQGVKHWTLATSKDYRIKVSSDCGTKYYVTLFGSFSIGSDERSTKSDIYSRVIQEALESELKFKYPNLVFDVLVKTPTF